MSGVILLACAFAIAAKGISFGIDFESGTRITASLERSASVDQVRSALGPAGLGDAEIQTLDNPELGENVVQISTEQSGRTNAATDALDDEFGLTETPDVSEIGPTFGESVANSAVIAIIASLIVISIYIALRFEWKFAVPVLIALAHDLLITAGVYALLGLEVTTSTVAALLTILGFSLYDTIIVFDRVRENQPRMPSATFSQIYNRSMSEVLTRSLATSFCTVLPVIALALFGGETLRDFALALIIGTISGTYSSVFIAGPVLTHWKERDPLYRMRRKRLEEEHGEVPAFAVATAGRPVDVDPEGPRRRGGRSLTAPQDPSQVSREEFDDMVRDLDVEEERPAATPARRPRRQATVVEEPERGAVRMPEPEDGDGAADARPEDVVMPEDTRRERDRRPRNRRHGRPR
jgi:SecD/SecF fusion protein